MVSAAFFVVGYFIGLTSGASPYRRHVYAIRQGRKGGNRIG